MARSQIGFFATMRDLAAGLARVEAESSIQYVLTGLFPEPTLQCLGTFQEIPDLGESSEGSAVRMPQYMVLGAGTEVVVREVPQRRGGVLFAVDLVANASGMMLQLAGSVGSDYLIPGRIAPNPGNPTSEAMYKLFRRCFLAGFKAVRSYRVGPDALVALDSGVALTPNVKAKQSMHLQR